MNTFKPFAADRYLPFSEVEAFCRHAADARPDLVTLETYGTSRGGLPLLLVTLSAGGDPLEKPAFWLDGGTHASEWTGVMACLYAISRWIEALDQGDPELTAFFQRHTVYVAPCLSPDGYVHLMEGGAFVRSTLRPPPDGVHRRGLEPQDVDGDGEVLLMRWRHPAGPWVEDPDLPMFPRRRRLSDDPADAFFICPEGVFLEYDGATWVMAEMRHGLDLNRNFPVAWTPFSQFGQDGGVLPLSEPESRAVAEAMDARPNVCAALTNHTYTGAILVAPYRPSSPLSRGDKETLWQLAHEAVEGTGWQTLNVYPQFIYEEGITIIGVWADHLVTNRGIPAYTLEIWDPFAFAGVKIDDPARNFARPELDKMRAATAKFAEDPQTWKPWTPFEHPQLGPVEIGGMRQSITFRNPPLKQLPGECAKAFQVADRLRRALPSPRLSGAARREGGAVVVEVVAENLGYLSTSSLQQGAATRYSREPSVALELPPGARLLEGAARRAIPHLPGWGDAPQMFRANPLMPGLATQPSRLKLSWLVEGEGAAEVVWSHPRTGRLRLKIEL